MYGAILGEMAAFPHEFEHIDLTDRALPLLGPAPEEGPGRAGTDFSGATVMTAAVADGLLCFERRLPEAFAGKRPDAGHPVVEAGAGKSTAGTNPAGRTPEEGCGKDEKAGEGETAGADGRDGQAVQLREISRSAFEEIFREETEAALRRFGRAYPLAGYAMDLSIWLFREGASPSEAEEAGPAARVSPVAWLFQDDLYMMRHMAVQQAKITHRAKETWKAADAAACAVFLSLHGCTKEYISAYMVKQFGYTFPDEAAMRQELLRAGENCGPSLSVRAAMTAFLYGRDFEDVLRRAVSLGGRGAGGAFIASIAGSAAEAFFGIPETWKAECRRRLPAGLGEAADAFSDRVRKKKEAIKNDPAARARWESALTRASGHHPAAVQGNEPLEQAVRNMNEKRDRQSFVTALEVLRLRMNRKGRVFVPLVSAKRAENGGAAAADSGKSGSADSRMLYRLEMIRTRDGRLWQPAYTSRAELDRARAAAAEAGSPGRAAAGGTGMVLSYALDALLVRFLPGKDPEGGQIQEVGQPAEADRPQTAQGQIPAEAEGVVLNPYGAPLFLPRKTIGALFVIDREAKKIAGSRT